MIIIKVNKYSQSQQLQLKLNKKKIKFQQINKNTSFMSRKQFSTLTSQGKDYLFRTNNIKQTPTQPSLSQKQNKFLQHFQTINNVDTLINTNLKSQYNTENNESLYFSKLQSYTQSKISQIQRIIRSTQQQTNIKTLKNNYKLSKPIPVIHAKQDIKKNVQKINQFFNTQQSNLSSAQIKQQQQLFKAEVLEIGIYSQIVKTLQFQHKPQPLHQNQNQYPSIYNTPTQRQYYDTNPSNQFNSQQNPKKFINSNTQTQRPEYNRPQNQFTGVSLNQSPSDIKIRKADMLLVEILREKKRKGLVSDYYKIMELKLFELLDFILTDEPEFDGMSSIDKMKEVLKKLDSFKGKKIQGQNKINLLKIFFQQFRNLKNQIAQSQKKKPLQKVQNKPKQIKKQFSSKQTVQKQKKKQQNNDKWIRKPSLKETMSMGGDRKNKNTSDDKKTRSIKGMEDQWLGQMQ